MGSAGAAFEPSSKDTAEEEEEDEEDEDLQGPEPLFLRIGGPAAVKATVNLFYDKLIDDPSIAPFFEGVDMDAQRLHQYRFMLMAFGGPKQYDGRTLYEAHKHLIQDKGLLPVHFESVAGHLEASLRELAVPKPLVREVMRIVAGTRNAIFKDLLEQPSEGPVTSPSPAEQPRCCIIS